MSIFVVRHAETEQNASRVIQLPDASLSAAGWLQAQQLTERLAETGVTCILASDLVRAVETATCINSRISVPILLEPMLQERNFGDLRGVPYAELTIDPFAEEYVPPNGESWAIFHERVALAWERIKVAAAETAGNLLVVTHGLVCRALLKHHLSLVPGESVPDRWGNTGFTEIEGRPPWLVRKANCVAHLANER